MIAHSVLKTMIMELDLRVKNLQAWDEMSAANEMMQKISTSYLRLGEDLIESGQVEEGLATCHKALQSNPNDLRASYRVLSKLERLNRIDEAWAALHELENSCESPYEKCKGLSLLKARLEFHRGNPGTSCEILESFISGNPGHSLLEKAYAWLGKTLDSLGEYDSAMQAFENKNRMVSESSVGIEMIRKGNETLTKLEASLNWYRDKISFDWQRKPAINDGFSSPILLVGFPRSGTTLLDQILNSHSALTTLEEQYTLAGIAQRFYGCEEKSSSLSMLTDQEISDCRQKYWANVSAYLGEINSGVRVVDKLPLNIMYLDIFSRLFPDVKIIVALRDPRDVILSNYMQLYKLNPEMAINLNLVSSARYYSKVMALYLIFRKFLPDNIRQIRYEDLVCDPKGECTKLLEFIGAEWEEGLLRFHEKAKGRWISTPSYIQVAKPIYNHSVGRWRNYEKHLEEIIPILKPFADEFGYSS